MYIGRDDGTATWSEALAAVLQQPVVMPGFDPTRRRRDAFMRKILYELFFRVGHRADIRVHPYTACTLDRRSALVVLDSFGGVVGTGWQPMLARESIRRAGWVATISRAEQANLEAKFGRTFEVLTPYPHREYFVRPLVPSTLAAATRPLRVGYWGGWHPRKRIREAIESVRPSSSIHFYCSGAVPADLAARRDVTAVGRLSRYSLVEFIDSIHVALYPSEAEGFGLPPYEALLRGRPVVVRPLDCYGEYLRSSLSPGVVRLAADHDLGAVLASIPSVGSVHPSDHLQTPTLPAAMAKLREQTNAWLEA